MNIDAAFRDHHAWLWGLAYRMLGTAADADEVVQEAFVRAIERPPARVDRGLRPWLTTVTTNLALDRLRARKRTPYVGPWLPEPLATDGLPGWRSAPADPEAASVRREGVDYAWMVALEALTPMQRAVLVLRDALDLTGAETADVLGSTAGSVKVQLHRARRALASAEPVPPAKWTDGLLLARLASALAIGDAPRVASLLAPDVVALGDGAGVYAAALRPIAGPRRVARLYTALQRRGRRMGVTPVPRVLGGRAAITYTVRRPRPGWAARGALVLGLRDGRIARVWSVLAPGKVGQTVTRPARP